MKSIFTPMYLFFVRESALNLHVKAYNAGPKLLVFHRRTSGSELRDHINVKA
jgi:hypothetical protein